MSSSPDFHILQRAAEHAIRYRQDATNREKFHMRGYDKSLAVFSEELPERGMPAAETVDLLVKQAEPGLNTMTGPRFFGWVIGGSHPVGVAADILTSAWGQNTGNHHATPSAAAAEAVAANWLLDLLELPATCSIGFVTGATVANFVCLAAARNEVLRKVGWDVAARGLFSAPPIHVLIGDDAHTSVFSALQFIGLGHDRVLRVGTDSEGRMRPNEFANILKTVSGPTMVILQAGQVNSGAFDDFARIISMARAKDAWVHVDGAFGLWARTSPARKHLVVGVEDADSWATDGHKWLQMPYDAGYAIIRHVDAHRRAMTIAASYLPAAAEGERDPSHFVPELSRRARGFATWAIIKHLGRNGIADMVERHCRLATLIANRLRADNSIAILNDVCLNQIVVQFGAGETPDQADFLTRCTIEKIQQQGICYLGGAKWQGKQVMRLSVISHQTNEAEAHKTADAILSAWNEVRQAASGQRTGQALDILAG